MICSSQSIWFAVCVGTRFQNRGTRLIVEQADGLGVMVSRDRRLLGDSIGRSRNR